MEAEMESKLSSKSDQPLREHNEGEEAKTSGSLTITKKDIDYPVLQRATTDHSKSKKDVASVGEFSDPVYKKLARLNGEINKMTKDQLKAKLTALKLDTNGVKEVLKRRLKNFYKKQKLMKARIKTPGSTKYDYLVVIDFEATCEREVDDYQHEIIEFPAILVDVAEMTIADEFHSYCRPVLNPRLTDFCVQLTGITQTKVAAAPEFPQVLTSFSEWMQAHHLGDGHSFAIVTDGPWDMSRFLHMQCQFSGLDFPRWARKWVNIRKVYSNFYQCRRCGIEAMLISLGMSFEGQLHCGRDDARNIARIAMRLLSDGVTFKINEYLTQSTNRRKDRTAEVENVSSSNPIPSDICSEDELETGDGAKVTDEVKTKVKASKVDSELSSGVKKLSLCDEQDEGIEDLLAYYKLQSS
ncbi:3'-5' exoribonuclease 1-like isoform X1 [Haliotis rufescens]|uniref:3'-5' exoribonuclease 1-like isoform X1 n=1 Tax=Haliotis rufescens TaxID=6454 RepID=UPI00201F7A24|nr:3'-5' exoribonuclease 1-like isoform X1 [Haliotis rufescens]